ncbi:MAG: transposase [Oscillospiraceae bacterium]|nr:transposase [Oscillospiraceae bacterium]
MTDKRKNNRLAEFDYSTVGAYFITVCVKGKQHIFWAKNVGADIIRPQNEYILSDYGYIADRVIKDIPVHYPSITVDKYAIMPNHIHLLLSIHETDGRIISAPTISTVVGQMKRQISKLIGISIWQKSFYDHIIRNKHDYDAAWQYIDENPVKWETDEFYN